jgi:hypothetical protein
MLCCAGPAQAQDKLAAASSAVHALDRQLAKQLSNVRADVQQALAVTAGSVKAELEAAAAARDRQAARQLQKQLQGACVWWRSDARRGRYAVEAALAHARAVFCLPHRAVCSLPVPPVRVPARSGG